MAADDLHWQPRNPVFSKNRVSEPREIPFNTSMTKPIPQSIDPLQLTTLAAAVIAADRFPQLASIDGDQPRLRPVSPVRTDGFTVYVANLRSYHKTQEIAANPKVELCYLDDKHNQVRITGTAEILSERPLLEEIWNANPLMQQFLGSLDNPQLIVYRIVPNRVRYMQEWALEYSTVPLGSADNSTDSPTNG
jgi:general stress protein 26